MNQPASTRATPSLPLTTRLGVMSDRTRALLEYYFDKDCRDCFNHVPDGEEVDVIIVDYDHPGARASVADGQYVCRLPLLLMSFTETRVPGALLIAKPFGKRELQEAAHRLLEPLPTEVEAVAPQRGELPEAPDSDASESDAQLLERQHRLETKVSLLCGPPRRIEELASDDPEHRFQPERHLSGHLRRAQRRCDEAGVIAVRMTLPTMEIYLLHWLRKVMTNASLKSSRNVARAFRAFDDDEIVLTDYRSDTVNELVKRVNGAGKFSFSTEAFVWLSALFSARGRLPQGIDLDQPWQLNHWPNLTRLEPVPQCVETASAWSREPASLRQIIESTGHEPRHVTAFFNGARALDLIEPADTESSQPATPKSNPSKSAVSTASTSPSTAMTDAGDHHTQQSERG